MVDDNGEIKQRIVKAHDDIPRSKSRGRSKSRPAAERSRSVGSEHARRKIDRLQRDSYKKIRREAKAGEGDKRILNAKPRHLFSGKRSNGKTDRR